MRIGSMVLTTLTLVLSSTTTFAEVLQCGLKGASQIITLDLQPPRIAHQVAGQKAISVISTMSNDGIISYKLPNNFAYILNYSTMAYSQKITGKPIIEGSCKQVFANKPQTPPAQPQLPVVPTQPPALPIKPPKLNIPSIPKGGVASCGKKLYCKQMTSCQEATYYLKHCGLKKLDQDGDGVPCENVCGTR